MRKIKIENYPGIFYLEDDRIGAYLEGDMLDLSSKTYKAQNKKKAIKDFTLFIRASKRIGQDVLTKQKKVRYENVTIREALKDADRIKEDLLEKMIAEHEAKLKGETKPKENPLDRTLNDVWNEFYDHKVNGTDSDLKTWKASTAKTYESFYNVWIKDTRLGKKRIGAVTKDDTNSLITKVKSERSLRTATTVIEILRPMFDWYIEKHDLNMRNPVPKKGKSFKLNNARVIDIGIEEIRSLYKAIDSYDNELFRNFFLWVRTGRRRGEVIALKLGDIDLIDKTFMVRAEVNKAGVDMTYRLRPELEATVPNGDHEEYLFASPVTHGAIHPDSVKKHWNKLKEGIEGTFKLNGQRVGIADLHLHDLRHIVSGVLKRAEVPEEVRAKVLGHTNGSITDRYGASYYEDSDRAYQLFEDIVYGVVPEDTKWFDYRGESA